jgi:hypothetical protein
VRKLAEEVGLSDSGYFEIYCCEGENGLKPHWKIKGKRSYVRGGCGVASELNLNENGGAFEWIIFDDHYVQKSNGGFYIEIMNFSLIVLLMLSVFRTSRFVFLLHRRFRT